MPPLWTSVTRFRHCIALEGSAIGTECVYTPSMSDHAKCRVYIYDCVYWGKKNPNRINIELFIKNRIKRKENTKIVTSLVLAHSLVFEKHCCGYVTIMTSRLQCIICSTKHQSDPNEKRESTSDDARQRQSTFLPTSYQMTRWDICARKGVTQWQPIMLHTLMRAADTQMMLSRFFYHCSMHATQRFITVSFSFCLLLLFLS